ncbi:MAG: glycosyltransferase family 39 protein, partial [Chloroflexi bacterium]|nr:glycosyltransferase family 39 protein [Chloroflexota bacterium]
MRVALVAILLVAWSTRVYRLDALSFWLDEGFTAYHASQPLGDLLASLANDDNHPPLHYVALHFWSLLAGTSDYALRFFSAAAGALTVAVMARLGKAFGSQALGLLGALLLAISPFHVWYSQEVRMYALVALLGSTALLSLMLALGRRRSDDIPTTNRRRLLFGAYALAMGAALLTHYYAFLLLPVALALLLLSSHQRDLGAWIVASGGALLIFSPWLPTLWAQYRRGTPGYWPEATPLEVLAGLWRSFSAGENTSAALALPASLLAAALVAAGLVAALVQREERRPVAWLAVWWLLPMGAALLLSTLLRVDLRATGRMYYISALPAFLLLVAWGALSLFRLRRLLLAAVLPLVGVTVLSLQEQFLLQGKEDFRGAVSRLEQEAWPEDAIILNAEHIYPVFLHYYRGALRWFRAEVGDEEAIDRWLRRTTRGREFVWLLTSHTEFSDPLAKVRGWFDSKGLLVTEQWYPGVRLASYALGPRLRDGPPAIETAQPVAYEGGLRLAGFRLAPPQPGSGRLLAALIWHPEQRLAENYRSHLMVFDSSGRLWAQDDRVALAEASPSSTWLPGSYLV